MEYGLGVLLHTYYVRWVLVESRLLRAPTSSPTTNIPGAYELLSDLFVEDLLEVFDIFLERFLTHDVKLESPINASVEVNH